MSTTTLGAAADAYVRDGSFAGQNFGNATELDVKVSGPDFNRESLLRFDLTGIAGSVTSAKLRLYGGLQDTRSTNVLTDIYGTGTSWSESTVNWNNRPATTTSKLATITVTDATQKWYEVDLTAYLQSEKAAGHNLVSLLLRNPATSAPYTLFKSKETSTANKPQLVVTDNAVPAPAVVGIVATDASAAEPGTDTGLFTLTRTGGTLSSPLAVNYTIGGSATNGGDYTGLSGTATFAANSATATILVTPIDDANVEGSENVILTLQPSGTNVYTLDSTKTSATVDIADNDSPTAVQMSLVPIADAYVRDGSSSKSNFGTATELVVKQSGVGFNREAFTKFDLSTLGGSVTSAKLRIFGRLQDNSGANVSTDVYGTGLSWTESGITWDTKPAITSAKLGSAVVLDSTARWYEVDVTSWVQTEQAAGHPAVALTLSNGATASPYSTFTSRESASNKPQLLLTVDTTVQPPPPNSGQTPFNGTAAAVPGRIQAENFDEGGEGIAYHDVDSVNQHGAYRPEVGVDIEDTNDTGGGYAIGNIRAGEWLEYTANIANAGSYDFAVRFASGASGGTAHLELDGVNVSGVINLPSTGDWQSWTTAVKTNISLPAGTHLLRFAFDTTGQPGDIGNLNWIQLTPTPPPAVPPRWPTSWQTAASALNSRFEAAGTVVGTKIFVFGGFKGDFTVHRTYTSYNTATNTWTNLGTMPVDMAESHQELAVDGQYIYIAGGFAGNLDTSKNPTQTVNDKVWRYDTVGNTFTQIATLPQARGAGTLDLIGRELHYFGGNPADRVTNLGDHFVYNLDTGIWTTAAPMPNPKDHFSSVVLNGKIYAFGGEHGHDQLHEQQRDMWMYDPTSNSWTQLADMPISKSHMEGGSFVLDGKIVMAGGQIDNFQPTANVIAYDPNTNSWTTLQSLPAARQGGIVRAIGDRVYQTIGGSQTNSPQSGTWVGNLPLADFASSSSSPSSAALAASAMNGGVVGHLSYTVLDDGSIVEQDLRTGASRIVSAAADRPFAGSGGSVVLFKKKLFIFGGDGGAAGKVQIFDTVKHRWKVGRSIPTGTTVATPTVEGSKVFFDGARYDLAHNRWKVLNA